MVLAMRCKPCWRKPPRAMLMPSSSSAISPARGNGKESLRAIFSALGEGRLPTFWVPGAADAPLSAYLRESYNMEIVHPHLHGVHGTFAIGPGRVLFAGMGGELVDERDATRLEDERLRYPAWELEYRLKTIRELREYEKVFLFATQPAHKGLHGAGSEALAVLINTYRPRLAVVPGDAIAETRLGTTLVVRPGRLEQGEYALIDLHDLSVQPRTLVDQASLREAPDAHADAEVGGGRGT